MTENMADSHMEDNFSPEEKEDPSVDVKEDVQQGLAFEGKEAATFATKQLPEDSGVKPDPGNGNGGNETGKNDPSDAASEEVNGEPPKRKPRRKKSV